MGREQAEHLVDVAPSSLSSTTTNTIILEVYRTRRRQLIPPHNMTEAPPLRSFLHVVDHQPYGYKICCLKRRRTVSLLIGLPCVPVVCSAVDDAGKKRSRTCDVRRHLRSSAPWPICNCVGLLTVDVVG